MGDNSNEGQEIVVILRFILEFYFKPQFLLVEISLL
jgi:hypothetical protein